MYAKVSELANRLRVSKDCIYLWIRSGVIPDDCVDRVGSTIRVDAERFDQHLRDKKLSRPRRPPATRGEMKVAMAEDNSTTTGTATACEHRWQSESGRVSEDHPYAPELEATNGR